MLMVISTGYTDLFEIQTATQVFTIAAPVTGGAFYSTTVPSFDVSREYDGGTIWVVPAGKNTYQAELLTRL